MSRWVLLGLVAASACGGGAPAGREVPAAGPLVPAESSRPRIVVLGDAVVAGVGLLEAQAVPGLLQGYLDQSGYDVEVASAGAPFETTATALERVPALLAGNVRILVLAVGREDGRRGVAPSEVQANLSAIVEAAETQAVAVLLAAPDAPTTFGEEYAARFSRAFQEVARRYRVVFVPDLLEGLNRRELLQPDGVHPNAEGARVLAERLWRALQPMVDDLPSG